MTVQGGVCPADPKGGPHTANDAAVSVVKGLNMFQCTVCFRLFGVKGK